MPTAGRASLFRAAPGWLLANSFTDLEMASHRTFSSLCDPRGEINGADDAAPSVASSVVRPGPDKATTVGVAAGGPAGLAPVKSDARLRRLVKKDVRRTRPCAGCAAGLPAASGVGARGGAARIWSCRRGGVPGGVVAMGHPAGDRPHTRWQELRQTHPYAAPRQCAVATNNRPQRFLGLGCVSQ